MRQTETQLRITEKELEFQRNNTSAMKEKYDDLLRKVEYLEHQVAEWREKAEKAELERDQIETEAKA